MEGSSKDIWDNVRIAEELYSSGDDLPLLSSDNEDDKCPDAFLSKEELAAKNARKALSKSRKRYGCFHLVVWLKNFSSILFFISSFFVFGSLVFRL